MPNTIRLKRRASGGASGAPSSLEQSEPAYNEVDSILYLGIGNGGAGGSATSIVAIGGSGAYVSLTGAQTISGNKTLSGIANVSGTLQLAGVAISASAAEINVLTGATAGTAVAGKALVVDASKNLTLNGGSLTVQGLTVAGDLTINGTTTTINSTTVTIDDKLIELGATATPSDATADGGGFALKGTTDHSILWVAATSAWQSSENLTLAAGREFRISASSVLSSSTLGSGVTSSSLTSVGTIATGIWQGTPVGLAYGGSGGITAQASINALTQSAAATAEHVLTKDTATGNAIWKAASVDNAILDGGTF